MHVRAISSCSCRSHCGLLVCSCCVLPFVLCCCCPLSAVVGLSKDKDIWPCLAELMPHVTTLHLVQSTSARATPVQQLEDLCKQHGQIHRDRDSTISIDSIIHGFCSSTDTSLSCVHVCALRCLCSLIISILPYRCASARRCVD